MYEELLAELIDGDAFDEWDVSAYGDTFICPCGDEIELDGRCSEGHISPMLLMGMI